MSSKSDCITFVALNGDSLRKLEEIERLFVDSLRCFTAINLAYPSTSAQPRSTSISNVKDYYKQLTQFAYEQVQGPVILEGRCLQLDGTTEVHYGPQLESTTPSFNFENNIDKKGSLSVFVFYTEDGSTMDEFATAIPGHITKPRGVSSSTDSVWVPEGYTKTLAELGEHVCVQNEPYLGLSSKLRKHIFSGIMEVHIFIAPINPSVELQAHFKETCAKNGMKACNLRLDFVKHGFLQVLMSSRYIRGTMDSIWQDTFHDARLLAKLGFDVIRTKIEATASIDGVPETDDQAIQLPPKSYFEFHMVFSSRDGTMATDVDAEEVKQIAKKLEARWGHCIPLSTNAFGTQKFLNMRTYGIGRNTAHPRLAQLQSEVEQAGFKVPRFIREFGVYDTDVRLDAGWLEPPEATDHLLGFIPRW